MTWYAGLDEDALDAGPYATEGEALRLAPTDLGLAPTSRFFLARREPWHPAVDAAIVLSQVGVDAFEACGPEADSYLENVQAVAIARLQEGLQRAFDAWLEAHKLRQDLFQTTDRRECICDGEADGHVIL